MPKRQVTFGEIFKIEDPLNRSDQFFQMPNKRYSLDKTFGQVCFFISSIIVDSMSNLPSCPSLSKKLNLKVTWGHWFQKLGQNMLTLLQDLLISIRRIDFLLPRIIVETFQNYKMQNHSTHSKLLSVDLETTWLKEIY